MIFKYRIFRSVKFSRKLGAADISTLGELYNTSTLTRLITS